MSDDIDRALGTGATCCGNCDICTETGPAPTPAPTPVLVEDEHYEGEEA